MSTLGNIIGNTIYNGGKRKAPLPLVENYVYANDTKSFGGNAFGMNMSPDGQFFNIALRIDRTYYSFVGGPNWELSTRTSPNNYRYSFIPEIASGGSCWSGTWSKDGTKLFLGLTVGTGTAHIDEYNMAFPYEVRQGTNNPDVSQGAPYYNAYTPVYQGRYNTNGTTGADSINDLCLSPDGVNMNWIVLDGNQKLVHVTLDTPNSTAGGVTNQTVTSLGTSFAGYAMYIPPGGNLVYLATATQVQQFEISGWDTSTINTGSPISTLTVSGDITGTPRSIMAYEEHLYVLDGAGVAHRYSI